MVYVLPLKAKTIHISREGYFVPDDDEISSPAASENDAVDAADDGSDGFHFNCHLRLGDSSGQQGSYIRKCRHDAGMSLKQLADLLDISFVYLGEIERGRRGPMLGYHWPKLLAVLPEVDIRKLQFLALRDVLVIALKRYSAPGDRKL